MFFDLHNDRPTCNSPDTIKTGDAIIINAIWTTRLTDPNKFITDYYNNNANELTAIEDLGFVSQDTAKALDTIGKVKPLYASLTWNEPNSLAGGALGEGGLTTLGKDIISELNRQNITLDTAHLNRQSFFELAQISTRPIICSHTCIGGVFSHVRNLTDEQIRIIIASGGIVGLTLVSSFMGVEQAGIGDIIRQIDYYCGKFGHQTLAIGTDFYGTDRPALSDYTRFDELRQELYKCGYTSKQVDDIFYNNAKEFFKIHI